MTSLQSLNVSCQPGIFFFDAEDRTSWSGGGINSSATAVNHFPTFPQPGPLRTCLTPSISPTTTSSCFSFPEPDYPNSSSIPARALPTIPTSQANGGPCPSFPEPYYSIIHTGHALTTQATQIHHPRFPQPDYSNILSTASSPSHGSSTNRSSHDAAAVWNTRAWTEPIEHRASQPVSKPRDRGFGVDFHRDIKGMAQWVKRKLLGRESSHQATLTSNHPNHQRVLKPPPEDTPPRSAPRSTGHLSFPTPEVNAHVNVHAFPPPNWLVAERNGSHAYAAWNGCHQS